jgi:hypothetical protein
VDDSRARAASAEHERRVRLNQRLRRAFIAGAEADSRRRLGRGLTAGELERVLWHYPGDVATPQEGSMSRVEVTAAVAVDGWDCIVTVRDGSETRHRVRVSIADLAHLDPGASDPVGLVEASFAFLLEREPKELILREFDLTVIGRYFPEYEREIGHRLARQPLVGLPSRPDRRARHAQGACALNARSSRPQAPLRLDVLANERADAVVAHRAGVEDAKRESALRAADGAS